MIFEDSKSSMFRLQHMGTKKFLSCHLDQAVGKKVLALETKGEHFHEVEDSMWMASKATNISGCCSSAKVLPGPAK